MSKLFFDSWESMLRTVAITVLSYPCLIVFLRVSGKRTLSKMNAFDFVITIALGSTFASVLLTKSVVLADGLLALFLLIGQQYLWSYIAARSKSFSNLIKAKPSLLVYKGKVLTDVVRKERINDDELQAAIRQKGLTSLQQAGAIVLETDGSLTVIGHLDDLEAGALNNVSKPRNLH